MDLVFSPLALLAFKVVYFLLFIFFVYTVYLLCTKKLPIYDEDYNRINYHKIYTKTDKEKIYMSWYLLDKLSQIDAHEELVNSRNKIANLLFDAFDLGDTNNELPLDIYQLLHEVVTSDLAEYLEFELFKNFDEVGYQERTIKLMTSLNNLQTIAEEQLNKYIPLPMVNKEDNKVLYTIISEAIKVKLNGFNHLNNSSSNSFTDESSFLSNKLTKQRIGEVVSNCRRSIGAKKQDETLSIGYEVLHNFNTQLLENEINRASSQGEQALQDMIALKSYSELRAK